MQGVVKAFDPETGFGSVLAEPQLAEIELAENALEGTIFRFLRQGQRLNFDLDEHGHAVKLHFGSEPDMATPTQL